MENLKGKFYLACAFILAGTSVVTGRVLSEKLGTFTITAGSLGLLLICLFPFYLRKILKTLRRMKKYDWLLLLLQAVFGIFLFRVLLLIGIRYAGAAQTGVLTGTTPAITAFLAFTFLHEKLTATSATGIGCTVAGIIMLNFSRDTSSFLNNSLWGNIAALGAAASESAFNIISRKHKTSANDVKIVPMVQAFLVSALAFIPSAGAAAFERPIQSLASLHLPEWAALLWYGLVVTAIAFACFYEGIKRCKAQTAAAFSGLIPLTSLMLSIFFLKEKINLYQWAGSALIVLAILMIGKNTETINERNEASHE